MGTRIGSHTTLLDTKKAMIHLVLTYSTSRENSERKIEILCMSGAWNQLK